MIRNSVILTGVGMSDPIRMDPNETHIAMLAQMIFGTSIGTATVEYTPDKPDMRETTDNWVNSRWFPITQLTDQTGDISALIDTPVEGTRLNVTVHTSGPIELKMVQGYRT